MADLPMWDIVLQQVTDRWAKINICLHILLFDSKERKIVNIVMKSWELHLLLNQNHFFFLSVALFIGPFHSRSVARTAGNFACNFSALKFQSLFLVVCVMCIPIWNSKETHSEDCIDICFLVGVFFSFFFLNKNQLRFCTMFVHCWFYDGKLSLEGTKQQPHGGRPHHHLFIDLLT